MPTTHLLYLHGFRSSPQSMKARIMAREVALHHPEVTWCCPQLPPSPAHAMAQIRQLTQAWPSQRMAVVGSSLGGLYATVLGYERQCPLVLLNPAVDPQQHAERLVGEHLPWHGAGEPILFERKHVNELSLLRSTVLSFELSFLSKNCAPPATLLVAETGDEVLNWREMVSAYPNAQQRIVQGGDHAMSDFDDHLATVMAFLDLA
jgi:predicted esterase YcpF (UPF0227 family)